MKNSVGWVSNCIVQCQSVSSILFTFDNGYGWVLNDGAEKCRRESKAKANLAGNSFLYSINRAFSIHFIPEDLLCIYIYIQ